MLRIMSFLLLLIISQFSFAAVSYSTIAATSTQIQLYAAQSEQGYTLITDALSPDAACQFVATYQSYIFESASNGVCYLKSSGGYYHNGAYRTNGTKSGYTCSSGYFLSDAQGNPSSSGQYCTTSNDSCESLAGTTALFWVSYQQAPSVVCSGTCTATVGTHGDAPDYPYVRYRSVQYTFTGETAECTTDSGFSDDATATAANAAAAESERVAAVDAAVDAAKAGCGAAGYTTGTFNGDIIVNCNSSPTQTTVNNTAQSTTTTANADGSTTTTTTTTTTNNTTINNNNSSTTIGSNGSSSTTSGTTGGSSSSTTKTESVTTNPDGTTTTEITETTSGAGNTAGVFEEPGEGTDYLKDIFSSQAIEDLKQAQESTKQDITALQSSLKNLFNFGSVTASGTMVSDTKNIMGVPVDLSGKSAIDLFTQAGIGSAFWLLAILIGITVVLTKRN